MTVIEIRPHCWGWKCFEAPGVEPVSSTGPGTTTPWLSAEDITQMDASSSALQELKATVAEQQKEIQALTARLEEQASQIQKVSAQLEMSHPAPQTVVENH